MLKPTPALTSDTSPPTASRPRSPRPKDPELTELLDRATLALLRGQPDLARTLLSECVALDPGNERARRLLLKVVPGRNACPT